MGIWDLRKRAKEILNHKMDSLNFLILLLTIIGLYVVFWIVTIIMFILGYSVSSVLDNPGLELILVMFFTLGVFFIMMLTPMYNIFATHISVLATHGMEGHILKHLKFDDVINYIVTAFKTTCVVLSVYLTYIVAIAGAIATTSNLDIESTVEYILVVVFCVIFPSLLIAWLISAKFIFTYQIILIEECGFFRACINSWKLTNKCYGKVLLMELSFIPWYLVSYIPVLGNFVVWCYVLPYKKITYTILYHELMNDCVGIGQENKVTADWVSNQDARYDSMFSQQPVIKLAKSKASNSYGVTGEESRQESFYTRETVTEDKELSEANFDTSIDNSTNIGSKYVNESEVSKITKELEETLDRINNDYMWGE